MYVIKNLSDFIKAVENEEKVIYGKKLSFVHSKSIFSEEAWKYVEFIRKFVHKNDMDVRKEMYLKDEELVTFLMMNLDHSIEYQTYELDQTYLHIVDQDPSIKILIRQWKEDQYQMTLPALDVIEDDQEFFVRIREYVYHCSNEYIRNMSDILRLADREKERNLYIRKEDMHQLYNEVLADLEETGVIDHEGVSFEEFLPQPLSIAYYLDENEKNMMMKIMATYGDETFNLLDSNQHVHYRNHSKEMQALEAGTAYFTEKNMQEKILYFPKWQDDKSYQLFDTGIDQLEQYGKVFASRRFRVRRISRSPGASIGISLDGGLLTLNIDSDEFSRDELADIMKNYRRRQKYYRLRNGDFISLENNALATISEIIDGLQLKQKDLMEEEIRIPQYRACYIDQMLKGEKGLLQVNRSTDYKKLIRNMKDVEDSDYAVPKELNGTLRGYQKTGYRWMRTLAEYGFGGILADDMGLGKTIQTIAYLLGRKAEGASLPSLIICPASLVYNWQKEIERFAPSLTVKMVSGTARARESIIHSKEPTDVWITSYDMVKRDVELYAKKRFDTQIIDEAQNIKNYYTQAAKAVKKIHSDIRFALTGTPIENRLSELWSIFDYLMPGILGNYQQFRGEYEIPVIQNGSEDSMERLKKMVSSFILRRVKKDVLTELPEKVEQVLYAQMEAEQKKLYLGRATRLVESLRRQTEQEVRKGKIEILAELTRLRQICCDPRLLYEDFTAAACKVDMCEELIKEAVEGNNKVLVFSQFTSIFPILEEKLKKAGIAYYKLTGETPKMQRVQMAESFNEDEVPVFLISLKAGGTGLNLTGASIVIHFDPWWNIAAQNQATDRAHRIGQKNQVTVYKLIAKDTIEEKIIDLQEKKRVLAEEVLDGDHVSAATLDRDTLLEILA
jgi:hypothetical protein